MENRCSSLKRGDIIISPQRMKFINHGILFVTEEGKSDSLDEDRILLACIEQSGKDGAIRTRLPVEEITSDTEGRFSSVRFTVHGAKSRRTGWAPRRGNC